MSAAAEPCLLLALLPELQLRCYARLSTKERAGLPLVCKALERLVNSPGSPLWQDMELTVSAEHRDVALRGGARELLRARGQCTRTLSLRFAPDLPRRWCTVFATVLLSLFPELRELAVKGIDPSLGELALERGLDPAGCYFSAKECQLVLAACPKLRALRLGLTSEGYAAGAFASLCEASDLTSLWVERPINSGGEVQAVVKPLQGLNNLKNLRHLSLRLGLGLRKYELPASLLAPLASLESLCLQGCVVSLPATLSRLCCLTALEVSWCSYANLWAAVSGLQFLKRLSFTLDSNTSLPVALHPAPFASGLQTLRVSASGGRAVRLPQKLPAADRCLALPSLQLLDMCDNGVSLLRWGSLTSLRALLSDRWDSVPVREYRDTLGLSRLSRLCLSAADDVTDAVAAELCQLKGLRNLSLSFTSMTVLPASLASAQLTALDLSDNEELELEAAGCTALWQMQGLQRLRLCVCNIEDNSAPAVQPQSLEFLQAISDGLDACIACTCHAEGWYPGGSISEGYYTSDYPSDDGGM